MNANQGKQIELRPRFLLTSSVGHAVADTSARERCKGKVYLVTMS
jgi:hypothetical protein